MINKESKFTLDGQKVTLETVLNEAIYGEGKSPKTREAKEQTIRIIKELVRENKIKNINLSDNGSYTLSDFASETTTNLRNLKYDSKYKDTLKMRTKANPIILLMDASNKTKRSIDYYEAKGKSQNEYYGKQFYNDLIKRNNLETTFKNIVDIRHKITAKPNSGKKWQYEGKDKLNYNNFIQGNGTAKDTKGDSAMIHAYVKVDEKGKIKEITYIVEYDSSDRVVIMNESKFIDMFGDKVKTKIDTVIVNKAKMFGVI